MSETEQKLVMWVDDAFERKPRGMLGNIFSILQWNLGRENVLAVGPKAAYDYFSDGKRTPDLLVCDHNLWFSEDDLYMRWGFQLIKLVAEMGIVIPPIIIFSDDEMAPSFWEGQGVDYEKFVLKNREAPKYLPELISQMLA